jgi:opine dehydrogenase
MVETHPELDSRTPHTERVAVVGGGSSARALAAWLSAAGHDVRLLVHNVAKMGGVRRTRTVRAIGRLEGVYPLQAVTEDWRAATECSTIFLATVTNAYPEVVRRLRPHLTKRHTLVLFSSKLAGSVEVERILHAEACHGVRVLETDALFACRVQADDSVWIRGVKGWTLYSAAHAHATLDAGDALTRFFPALEPATNVLQRGLTDFGALCHPVTMIANVNQVDRQQPFKFYYEGFTERTIVLLERMEQEFHAVAAAYGTTVIPMTQLLERYYGCETTSLLDAMRSVPNYRHSVAPDTLNHRYLTEDVPNTLVPLFGMARVAGLPTPMLDSVVHMASVLCGEDFRSNGRTLARLGWDGLDVGGIVDWMR